MTNKEFTKRLPCPLTDEERRAKATMLASAIDKMERVKERKKAAASEFAAQLKQLQAEADEAKDSFQSGTEYRAVKCIERLTSHGTVEIVRLDSNEVVESRRASDADRQLELKPAESKDEKPAKEKKPKKPVANGRVAKPRPKKGDEKASE